MFAAVFGSAARGDGNLDSDIDFIVVHPLLTDDPVPARDDSRGRLDKVLRSLSVAVELVQSVDIAQSVDADVWYRQIDELRSKVQRWTGNPLQTVDLSYIDWLYRLHDNDRFLAEIQRDAVELVRPPGFRGPSGIAPHG